VTGGILGFLGVKLGSPPVEKPVFRGPRPAGVKRQSEQSRDFIREKMVRKHEGGGSMKPGTGVS